MEFCLCLLICLCICVCVCVVILRVGFFYCYSITLVPTFPPFSPPISSYNMISLVLHSETHLWCKAMHVLCNELSQWKTGWIGGFVHHPLASSDGRAALADKQGSYSSLIARVFLPETMCLFYGTLSRVTCL